MVICSKESRGMVFHLPHCGMIRKINKRNRIVFSTEEEARRAGYRQCDCCSVVGRRYRREQKAVDAFCSKHRYSCFLFDGQLHIQAPDSAWRLIAGGKKNLLFLYHKNTVEELQREPSCIPGFHYQPIRRDTVLGYLETIADHDKFRKKEQRKKAAERDFRRGANACCGGKRGKRRGKGRGGSTRRFNASQLYSLTSNVHF